MKVIASLLAAGAGALLLTTAEACTTLIAGKDATVDGSVMATHSDDGFSNPDPRLVRIPARRNIPPGTKRPIYWDTEDYPRHVGKDRGAPEYFPQPGQAPSVPIGYIDEVESTYAYFEATYAIQNEKQVGIGETTCSGVFGANATGHSGQALFSIDALSRIALERADTARKAVQLMGDLAVQHGFYGSDSFEGSAESLMVVDPTEGFVFHVLPDDTGTSAVWVAQRVPDDQVGVVANMFTIRGVDLTDSHNFLGSENMHSIAQKYGWWDPSKGPLDFTAVYSDGEYDHLYYSGRRMWGAYRMLAPSVKLPTNYTDLRFEADVYPTFLKPDTKTSVAQLRDIHRSYYEGTPYDLTKGVAAGPYGDPDRYALQTSMKLKGSFERSIGLYRTSQTHVIQARGWLPDAVGGVFWYGPHAAPTSVFTPFFVGTLEGAPSYANSDPGVLDRSAFWAHRYVANVAKIRYGNMIQDIRIAQKALEDTSDKLIDELSNAETTMAEATPKILANAAHVTDTWWTLPNALIAKYADGWLDDGDALGYSEEWLMAAGYPDGPPPPPHEPNVITAASCADAAE